MKILFELLQGGVCLAFADEVLCWLYGTVKESWVLHSFLCFFPLFLTFDFWQMNYNLECLNYDFRWRLHSPVWPSLLPIGALAGPILPGCHHESCGANAGMTGHLLLKSFHVVINMSTFNSSTINFGHVRRIEFIHRWNAQLQFWEAIVVQYIDSSMKWEHKNCGWWPFFFGSKN